MKKQTHMKNNCTEIKTPSKHDSSNIDSSITESIHAFDRLDLNPKSGDSDSVDELLKEQEFDAWDVQNNDLDHSVSALYELLHLQRRR